MDLAYTPEQEALRRALRAWLRRNLPAGSDGRSVEYGDPTRVPAAKAWQRKLSQAGWVAIGWPVERRMLGSSARTQQLFGELVRLARTGPRRAAGDPRVRQRLAALAVRVEAMRLHALRQLTDAARGRPPGLASAITKLVITELNHDLARAALELLGSYGPLAGGARRAVAGGLWPFELMFTLGMIIGGGTSQIQKNIISERGLGMPRR